ncbi:MAG: imidazole glycerol phosphate synthase subunit HisF [Bernardetiaceae bacterium]
MLCKRIIPCLDIKDGQVVKGVQFESLRLAGDPVVLGQKYAAEGADELVFLDITATHEKRKTLAALARRIAAHINIPFTVGGGVSSLEDIAVLMESGADKVTINSATLLRPALITEAAKAFGEQCVVVAIDARHEPTPNAPQQWRVYATGGRKATERTLLDWAREAADRGAGEILFTSMNHDGTKAGFALEAYRHLSRHLQLPIIASGGGGTAEHFAEVLQPGCADAALAASIFHFNELPLPELKAYLHQMGLPVRLTVPGAPEASLR